MKPNSITRGEFLVYNSFKCYQNKKGFLGELAVDKAINSTELIYQSNPKTSPEFYNKCEQKGCDHIIGNDIYIEVKNWGKYEKTNYMYENKIKSRFYNDNAIKIVIMANANLSERVKTRLINDDIFLIVVGNDIKLSNFDKCVDIIKMKLLNYLLDRCPLITIQFSLSNPFKKWKQWNKNNDKFIDISNHITNIEDQSDKITLIRAYLEAFSREIKKIYPVIEDPGEYLNIIRYVGRKVKHAFFLFGNL